MFTLFCFAILDYNFSFRVFESKTSGVTRFFHRQFWSAWKLLAAVLMWHKILNDKVIHELAIRSILNLYLLPALNLASEINISDCIEKAKHVCIFIYLEFTY